MSNRKTKMNGRKTREEIGKGNEMIALRFQTGVTSDIPPVSFGGYV